ncbi:MAG: DUF4261 domain-containing protein [Brevefilum sp.]
MNDLPQTSESFTPVLHLIYASPEIPAQNQAKLNSRLRQFDALAQTEPSMNWQIHSSNKCLGNLYFAEHHIQISGLSNPLPGPVIDRTINVSPWQAQIKASMRQHQSHLSLVYRGESKDPLDRMLALYRAAYSFKNENLLGVVNEPAWTAHPKADFLSIEKIEAYKIEIPFILWFGYVRIFKDKQRYWLVTKGHHLFDVPDLAFFVESAKEEETVINYFVNIFYYLYEQDAVVTAGDTLEIGKSGEIMQFSEVTEYTETLLGPAGTLVIEKVSSGAADDQTPSG